MTASAQSLILISSEMRLFERTDILASDIHGQVQRRSSVLSRGPQTKQFSFEN
jgi:hypothetical protein